MFILRSRSLSRTRAVLGVVFIARLSFATAIGQTPQATPSPVISPEGAITAPTTDSPSPDSLPVQDGPAQSPIPVDSLPAENSGAREDLTPPSGSSLLQNPQREFGPTISRIAGLSNDPLPPSELTAPAPSIRNPGDISINNPAQRPLLDPLAVTALGQAQSNDEMLFTGLGSMPRPMTSPYLYTDLSAPAEGFRRGDFSLNTAVSLGFNYLSSHGDQRGSSNTQFFGTISPEVDLTLGEPATGRLLSLQYFGSLAVGDTDGRQSPYDQSFSLRGLFALTKLTLGVGLQVTQFSGADRDFGGRSVDRGLVSLSLTGSYQYTEKTSFESDLAVPVRIFQFGNDSAGVSSTNFLNYAYSPITTVGVGFAVGTLTVANNATQVYEQVLTRIVYNGGPLVFNGTLGIEFRDTGHREEINPILGLGVTWQLREGTTLALTSERRVFNSAADSGDNYVASDAALTLTQRLGDRFQATASVGYENASYDNASGRSNTFSNREDNYVIVQGGVVAKLNHRWSASALATYGNNQSSGNAVNYFHTLVQFTFAY